MLIWIILTNMSTEQKEYIVTVHNAADLDDIYSELENPGCGCHDQFPERAIECLNRRPISRNTHYSLTAEEAAMISNDPRVLAVELNPQDRGLEIGHDWSETSSNFSRNFTTNALHRQWGLPRVWNGSNLPNYGFDGTAVYSGTVTVYTSATNVDVVIIDGHMNPANSEYAVNPDGTGGSRVNQFNWFSLNPLVTGGAPGTYVYAPYTGTFAESDNNHGAHCAGTVAGNTQGWARNATIYNISPYGSNPNAMPASEFDYVRAFHRNKPINPLTGIKNPTITNNSWGYRIPSVSASSIKTVNYRGTTYTTSTQFSDLELQSWKIRSVGGAISNQGVRVSSVDADIADAIADGVIVVGSAGNSSLFMDVESGLDYNNYYAGPSIGTIEYAKGASPGSAKGVICVGSIDVYKDDRKSTFSNTGPRIDIWAPGSAILSSTNSGGTNDPRGTGFLSKYSGTSMSGPQVTGILALVLGEYPTWTTTNIVSYFSNVYATGQIASTAGGTIDNTDLQGAPNRFLKVPVEFLAPPTPPALTSTLVTGFVTLTKDYPATSFAPVTATGGTTPYTWAVSPSLSSGLTFNTSTGFISGTPTVTLNTTSYTITVTDSASSSTSKSFSLEIGTTVTTVSVISNLTLTKDQAMSPVSPVSASGGKPPYVWSNSPGATFDVLGISLNPSTGVITGTPTALLSTTTYNIKVIDSVLRESYKPINLNVVSNAQPLTLNVPISSLAYPAYFVLSPYQPVVPSGGISPYSYSINPAVPVGLAFNTSTGILSGQPVSLLSTTTYTVTVKDSNSPQSTATASFGLYVYALPLSVTVDIPSTSINPYTAITPFIPVSASGGNGTKTLSISPALPAGLTFDSSTGAISGTANSIFSNTYTVTCTDSVGQTASGSFSLSSSAITLVLTTNVSTSTNIIFQPITPFTPITATGGSGSKSWSITPQLPTGVVFNTTNGTIVGTPTVQSPLISYTVTVTDQTGQTASRSFGFRVSVPALVTTIEVAKILFYPGTTITPFTPISVSGGGGTKVLSISPPLPQGLSFNTSTGVVSGTPTVNGRSNVYVVTATDQAGQTSSKSFKLKIKSRLDVIDADDQNIVYDKLFSLMGTTVTGYGAFTASKPVNYGQIVRDEDWDYMYDDLVRVKIHQYGTSTNNLLISDPSEIVLDGVQDRMYTWAQLHLATSSTVHPSQLSSMSINTNEMSPPQWISENEDSDNWTDITGNGYIAAAGFTWFRPAQLNYFFNLGGSITPLITLGAGTIRDLLAWDTLVEQANQIVFSKDEFYAALNSPNKSFIHIITGPGNFDPNNKKKNVKYKKTKNYTANGIIIKFQIVDSRILASIQFVAGFNDKKKKGKGKKKKKGNYIVVRLQINTDFRTEYSNANTGGIAAPIPQTQLINNCLSIDTRPVEPFMFPVGGESDTRAIELRNNSTQTCNITDIFLTAYTLGTVSPTTLTIPPHSSSYINLKYTGDTAGLYKGFVNIESDINNFTIFTQVEVGAISPSSLILTTGTTDIIYQEFTVDLVAGPYERFDAVLAPSGNGFTFVEHPTTFASEIVDRFNVTFDPTSRPNGLYATTATVTVYPLDNNNEVAVFEVPIEIDLNVKRYNIGRWISALGHQTSALGLSFDYIEGKRYVTVGIGKNSPLLSELGSVNTFTSWSEVYRMIIEDRFETLYSSDHAIKQETNYASNFGVGKAAGSIITVKNEKYGNIEIFLNSLRYPGDDDTTTKILKGLSQAFYYYDPTAYRVTQLETVNQLTNEGCTRYFKSFDKDGTVETTLVVPNRNS